MSHTLFSFQCVTWCSQVRALTCDMTHPGASTRCLIRRCYCYTFFVHTCDMTHSHSHLWHDEACHTCEWDMYCNTCINESCHTREWGMCCLIMSQVWMRTSHVTHLNKTCIFFKRAHKRDYILQKRPIIFSNTCIAIALATVTGVNENMTHSYVWHTLSSCTCMTWLI